MTTPNRRKDVRLGMALSVRVRGHELAGTAWEEMTRCQDCSDGGASFVVQHDVQHGQVLHLSLPMPKRFRRYDPVAPSYRVYALVHSARRTKAGTRVGVAFLGKAPPRGYDQRPGGRYAPDRRRSKRGDMFMKVHLKSDSGQEERTVLENYGPGGARVMTAKVFAENDVLEIEDAEGTFHARAQIRSIYTGTDGIRRLNLRFLS